MLRRLRPAKAPRIGRTTAPAQRGFAIMENNPSLTIEVEHQTVDNLRQTVPTALASRTRSDLVDFDWNEAAVRPVAQAELVL